MLWDGKRRKQLKKTIEYDNYDYGVILLLQSYLERLMNNQPNLNSLKNKHYQEPYEKGQQSIMKFNKAFAEMLETFNKK